MKYVGTTVDMTIIPAFSLRFNHIISGSCHTSIRQIIAHQVSQIIQTTRREQERVRAKRMKKAGEEDGK